MHSHLHATHLVTNRYLCLLREHPVPPREFRLAYEREGSEQVARGSVTVPSGGRWFSTLEVPLSGDRSALLTIGREGPGESLGPAEAALVIPQGEADAVLALLNGVIAQARADGVLRDRQQQ